ncbi:hypothetical protein REMIM1_PE00533 (plasmid) [Rhizobium etli bv. mimosae str. Mim1]|nr:hypothetical protein REMIM1_PE00533 [Rhizobium etli bv. mimosae str. Mim1]
MPLVEGGRQKLTVTDPQKLLNLADALCLPGAQNSSHGVQRRSGHFGNILTGYRESMRMPLPTGRPSFPCAASLRMDGTAACPVSERDPRRLREN